MSGHLIKLFSRFKRVISFGAVGIVNTLTDFLVFTACAEVFMLPPSVCQAIGYLSGVVCSFILNRRFTFRDGTGRIWRQILSFAAVNAASLAVSTLLISLVTDAGLNTYIAKVFVTLVSMLINYFGYKVLVFNVK